MSLAHLTCPNCQTTFRVDASAIPEDGRDVRCASCRHVWHATKDALQTQDATAVEPKEDMQDAFDALLGPPTHAAEADNPLETDAPTDNNAEIFDFGAIDEPDTLSETEDAPTDDALQAPQEPMPDLDTLFPEMRSKQDVQALRRAHYRKRTKMLAVLSAVLLVAIGLTSLLAFRNNILHHAPLMAPLYNIVGFHNSEAMRLADITFSRNDVADESRYRIAGVIINQTEDDAPAPTIRLRLLNADDDILREWTSADEDVIAAMEQKAFNANKLRSANPNVARLSLEIGSPIELSLRD